MKLIYGGVPYNTTKVRHYETNTNDATLQSSDLQAGVTAYAKGQKITGTGKCFEFAGYGDFEANDTWFIPSEINVVQISCTNHPIQALVKVSDTNYLSFTTEQYIGNLIFDNTNYPINVSVIDNILSITCDIQTTFQVFYGKDNYI